MVVVKKELSRVPISDGKGPYSNFMMIVKLSARDGTFSIELPEKIGKTLGKEFVTGKTLESVETAFSKSLKEYKKLLTKRKKVIWYEFKKVCNIRDEKGGCVLTRQEISFCEGTAVQLNYDIMYEHDVAGDKTLLWKNGNWTGKSIRDNPTYMDWTEDREQFFKDTKQFLEMLILRADKFFSSDKKTLLKMIDSKTRLLPEPKKETVKSS
ncbi:hypothetical protein LCGC14_2234230 [marine sediment metagenome]|uniref:Uncharacterized protein n=1 Tax=marine sediment metagenome TaxID=412755 RepID=A0A0F9D7J3_9ZZZZ